jgi:predicted ATPase/DNA-binding CsgD family transcriptional regulator
MRANLGSRERAGIDEIRDWLSTMARPLRRPGNLPAEATSFIGRRGELAEVRRKLAGARLVSLVGPGGVGKTRLAIKAATALGRGFPGGAWLVELADIRDPALVGNAVMAALDLRDQAAAEPAAVLRSHLRDKRLLLVVDTCEHLLGATAQLLAEVMRAAPDVRLITTSREPLAVPGEHVVPIPQLRQHEAVMLFAERAAAASGDFELTAANEATLAELCRRLDGLPLAIELAAVRTRVLTAQQILDRLTDRFGLLTGGGSVALPRQQTLRTTIDWSHDLLVAREQTLLRRLGVFAGRFTIEDVESVCAFDGVPAGSALDVLSALVDKSLVVKEDVKTVACYRLHETMREYACLKAREAGEEEAVESRCVEHYRASCRRSLAQARYRLVEWLDWMELEIDNVRAVLHRCVARQDRQSGLAVAGSMGWYWIIRATSEGVRWLDALLAPGGGSPRVFALAYFVRGFLAVLQSDPTAARPALDRAATAAEAAGQVDMRSHSLAMAANAAHLAGDRASARCLLDAAHAAATGLDDVAVTISLLQARAYGGLFEGDLETVSSASAEGARRSRAAGDLYSLGMMLVNQACATLIGGARGDPAQLFGEALRVAREIDDRVAQYCLLDAFGCHAAGSGQPRLAARLLGAADTVQAGIGASVHPYLAAPVARAEESARAALGERTFRAEFEAGQRLSRDAAIGLALGEPARVTAAAPDAAGASQLGKREAQVAELVADGLSNKQIGTRLLISEHTVDTHIRNILNKLGVNSRAQIAAWIAAPDE